jgi:hypothetical protein
MKWFYSVEIVSLLAGLGLYFADERIEQVFVWLNQLIFRFDHRFHSARIPFGLALVISGGWLISVASKVTPLWSLWLGGVLAAGVGLLYVFLPERLDHLVEIGDRPFIPTDDFILRARKKAGAGLIVGAVYMFLMVMLLSNLFDRSFAASLRTIANLRTITNIENNIIKKGG